MANQFTPGQILDAVTLNGIVDEVNTLTTDMTKARRGARKTVQNHVSSAHAYSTNAEMGVLTTSIVTEENNSQILYNLSLTYESQHDKMVYLQRKIGSGGWAEIASGNAYGSSYRGFMALVYDQNEDSTPMTSTRTYLDSPNAPAGTTIYYRILSRGNGAAFYINRTVNGSSAGNYERGSSSVQLTEMVV